MMRGLALIAMTLCVANAWSDDRVERGEQVFNRSCMSSLCHAKDGGLGGAAPRLANRGFNEEYIAKTVRTGVTGTAMPSFDAVLSRADLVAVIVYVDTLNGVTPSANPVASAFEVPPPVPTVQLPPKATRGRELFADPLRGVGACSSCHRVQNEGIGVSEAIESVPATPVLLRELQTPHVATVVVGSDSMPALVLSRGGAVTVFYDLTTSPPVLLSRDTSTVEIEKGSPWRHERFMAAYDDAELDAVLEYLRAVLRDKRK